ncbi:protein of unknown function [Chryseobacterium sp. JV274]|nr:protein of unknown function [Chryseobacterium sp. JV274]
MNFSGCFHVKFYVIYSIEVALAETKKLSTSKNINICENPCNLWLRNTYINSKIRT